jgi:hypothetical protein
MTPKLTTDKLLQYLDWDAKDLIEAFTIIAAENFDTKITF